MREVPARAGVRLPEWREARNDADVGGECACAVEARRIPDLGDDAGGSLRPDPVDRREQPADLVTVEEALNLAFDLHEASAPKVEILADVAGLQSMDPAMVLADGVPGAPDQALGDPVRRSGRVHAHHPRPGPGRVATGEGARGQR